MSATMSGIRAALIEAPDSTVSPEDGLVDVSLLIISFNTRDMLRECLQTVYAEVEGLPCEIIVVDNASSDSSAEMVGQEFPQVRLIRSSVNLGFGSANNLALEHARGRYFVLLNSDAFLSRGSLTRAIQHMDMSPHCALGGALLVGRDGMSQPSARSFHSLWRDALVLTGLAARFPKSKIFGGFDRTWADINEAAQVDWVPGAFAIVRPQALERIGVFDPAFFLYYEEVDLCLRLKQAGYEIWYWPDIVVTHIGGESSRQLKTMDFSAPSAQVVLWRMRSSLLYYRKHHGTIAYLEKLMEQTLYTMAVLRNRFSRTPERQERARHFRSMLQLMNRAWKDTAGGRISPPRPW